ncbi:MAG: GIY-YIG nuclease family protein [Candidatus Neomarinimicrobiota bacterium]
MYRVYVLYSKEIDFLYIEQTQDLKKRLREHREGASFYTRRARGWRLLYSEEFSIRSQTLRRDKELKTYRGREFIGATYLSNC